MNRLNPLQAIGRSLLILLLAGPIAQAAPFDVDSRHDVMVPMRDGVAPATDVYLPARGGRIVEGKWPTILMVHALQQVGRRRRCAISPHAGMPSCFKTRGRYHSEGVWHMLTDDGRDGVDTCAWIGKQTWSNGKIGTIGSSYVGGTQHAIALERYARIGDGHPHRCHVEPGLCQHAERECF